MSLDELAAMNKGSSDANMDSGGGAGKAAGRGATRRKANRKASPYARPNKGGGGGGGGGGSGRSVYVGNLSWDVSWQDLKDHFKTCGNVVHADVMTGHDGRSKGCGLVTFSSAGDAQAAINTLHDTELNGRLIFVREDREAGAAGGGGGGGGGGRGGGGGSGVVVRGGFGGGGGGGGGGRGCSVYVGNLSWDVSWQDLKDHFKPCGNVGKYLTQYGSGGYDGEKRQQRL